MQLVDVILCNTVVLKFFEHVPFHVSLLVFKMVEKFIESNKKQKIFLSSALCVYINT